MTPVPGRIDVHRHAEPPECLAIMQERGPSGRRGSGLPGAPTLAWDVERTLADMDACAIQTSILQGYGVHNLVAEDRRLEVARLTNDFFAGIVASHPQRFGAFAAVPASDAGAAIEEVGRALDRLGLDGVCLSSNYGGRYLGDPLFEPVLAELDRRQALVFIHPGPPPGLDQLTLDFPLFHLEFPFDTTRALANMIVHGVFERHSGIRFVVPHAGGAVPYLQVRLAAGLMAISGNGTFVEAFGRVASALRRLHVDVAVSASPLVLAALQSVTAPSRILLGGDCPPGPTELLRATIGAVESFAGFDDAMIDMVMRDNALALFPRLAGQPA